MKRKEMIERMMRRLGVPVHIKGYDYLVDAISLMCDDDTYKSAITKRLYPDIAKKNKTTSSRVERAIRHAIEVGMKRADNEYAQYAIDNFICCSFRFIHLTLFFLSYCHKIALTNIFF